MLSRQWKDINELWLERYLERAGLMPLWADDPEGADLYEDHPFGWQASWVLSEADWSRLRDAWQKHLHQESTTPMQWRAEQGAAEKIQTHTAALKD